VKLVEALFVLAKAIVRKKVVRLTIGRPKI
jgi:hypothetical protein